MMLFITYVIVLDGQAFDGPRGSARFVGTCALRAIYLSGSWDHVVTLVRNVPCGRSSAADSDLPSTHLLL